MHSKNLELCQKNEIIYEKNHFSQHNLSRLYFGFSFDELLKSRKTEKRFIWLYSIKLFPWKTNLPNQPIDLAIQQMEFLWILMSSSSCHGNIHQILYGIKLFFCIYIVTEIHMIVLLLSASGVQHQLRG